MKRSNEEQEQYGESPNKRVMSVVGNEDDGVNETGKGNEDEVGQMKTDIQSSEPPAVEKEAAVPQKVVPQTAQMVSANKKKFGMLTGHLGKAKKKIEEDSTFLKNQQSKRSLLSRLQSIDMEITKIDKAREEWQEKTITTNEDCLFTIIEPSLRWKPNKHSKETSTLVEERQEQTRLLLAEREEADEQKKSVFRGQKDDLRREVDATTTV